jgi:hypothetical protein
MILDKRNQHAIAYFLVLVIGISLFKINLFEDTFINRMIFYGLMFISGITMLIYHRKTLKKNVLIVQFSFIILMITIVLMIYL